MTGEVLFDLLVVAVLGYLVVSKIKRDKEDKANTPNGDRPPKDDGDNPSSK